MAFKALCLAAFIAMGTGTLSACSSRHYAGIHHLKHGQKSEYSRAVASRKADKEVKAVERALMDEIFARGLPDGARAHFSDSLRALMKVDLDTLQAFLARNGMLSGYREIGPAVIKGLDEALFKHPFKYYDALEGRYVLKGDSTAAVLTLWFDKVGSRVEVCAFGLEQCRPVSAAQCGVEEGHLSYTANYCSSVDRAGLTGRGAYVVPAR